MREEIDARDQSDSFDSSSVLYKHLSLSLLKEFSV